MTKSALRSAWIGLITSFVLTGASTAAAVEIGGSRGAVTLDGQPLTSGKITLYRDDGQFFGSKIKQGKYAIDCVPAGQFRVTIEGKGVPAKYGIEDASSITVTVATTTNLNVFDFALSSK